MSAKKTAFYGMFLALALVAGYIEQLIPIKAWTCKHCYNASSLYSRSPCSLPDFRT